MKRPRTRIRRICKKIERLWAIYPGWRLGQLLSNVSSEFESIPFHMEDKELERALDRYIEEVVPISIRPEIQKEEVNEKDSHLNPDGAQEAK